MKMAASRPTALVVATACASVVTACATTNVTEVSPVATSTEESGWWTQTEVVSAAVCTRIRVPGDVLFAPDSSELGPAAEPALAKAVEVAKTRTGRVTVTGYTDSQGPSNIALSQRRADTVANWITGHLNNNPAVIAVGKGESNPIADNSSASGRARNRRVEVTIDTGNSTTCN